VQGGYIIENAFTWSLRMFSSLCGQPPADKTLYALLLTPFIYSILYMIRA